MTLTPRHNPSVIRKELNAFVQANDAPGFIALCQSIKAEVVELVVSERVVEANRLLEVYSNALRDYENKNPAFTLQILPILPPSSRGTIRLLGVCEQVDAYIMANKIDLKVVSQVKDDGHIDLIIWALRKKNIAYVEQVVVHIAEYLHHNFTPKNQIFQQISHGILWALLDKPENRMTATPAIDEAIASLMKERPESQGMEHFYLWLAEARMPKTLLKALELASYCSYAPHEEDEQVILDALPKNPTALELHWIQRSLKIEGFTKKILLDESVDMEQYIEALRDSYQGKSRFNDLSISTLSEFSSLICNETLSSTSTKKRISLLLNAACEEETNRIGSDKTPEKIRDELLKIGIPESALRLVKMLRGLALEDALGL
jgi:hypothetical protein